MGNGFAQVIGKAFPEMIAETVDDKKVNLPQDVKGKYTLLGLAYSKKSED
jgi:alkyl hydroperoxide reductase subunit AhpC